MSLAHLMKYIQIVPRKSRKFSHVSEKCCPALFYRLFLMRLRIRAFPTMLNNLRRIHGSRQIAIVKLRAGVTDFMAVGPKNPDTNMKIVVTCPIPYQQTSEGLR